MRDVLRFVFIMHLAAAAVIGHAQPTIPTLSQPIPATRVGATPLSIDLRNFFGVPGVTGSIVQFTITSSTSGRVNVELFANEAPRHVANFLSYAANRRYDNTMVHRVDGLGTAAPAIIQGGGYAATAIPPLPSPIPRSAPITLEYNLSNTRGTLAAARTSDPNSATSEWFFNVQDNTTRLGPSNGGGYSVFGRVLGTGMSIIDPIGQLPVINIVGSAFTQIPLRSFTPSQTTIPASSYVVVNSVREIPLFPSRPGELAVLAFTAARSNTTVVSPSIDGSTLVLSPLAVGTANVTVRATDSNGNIAESTFAVTVTTPPLLNPLFTSQPISLAIASGNTVVFAAAASGGPTFQWYHNGTAVSGGTSSTLVVPSAMQADAGTYVCTATNAIGSTNSAPATLTVESVNANDVGRLINLSILTTAGSGSNTLTVGAVTGPSDRPAPLPLVIRAVGPTLGTAFGVSDVLADPQLVVNRGGTAAAVASNDDWGGASALVNAFDAVGAFRLPPASLDSATLLSASAGSYTVQVTGKGSASGAVIAELYDGGNSGRTADMARLINLSTLTQMAPGATVAVGFVIGGRTARTVLVRGIGPSLSAFGITEPVPDPKLELFSNSNGQKIAENDDWSGESQLGAVGSSVGAFSLANSASKDAAIVLTLAPGPYSARISGVAGVGGTTLIEVYEVP